MPSLIGSRLLVVGGGLAVALMLAGCAGTSGTAIGTSTPPPSTAVRAPVPNGGQKLHNSSGSPITMNDETVNPDAGTNLPGSGTIGLPSGTYSFKVDGRNFTFDGQTKFAVPSALFNVAGKYNIEAQDHDGMYVWVDNP